VLHFQLVEPLGRIIGGVDQLAARHPFRLIIEDVLPARLEQELAVLLQGAGEQAVAETLGSSNPRLPGSMKGPMAR